MTQIPNTLTTTSYWESLARSESGPVSIRFARLFDKYLVKTSARNARIIEIGCVPGVYLGYLAKRFGYFPEGIDYVKDCKQTVEKTLRNFNLTESIIYEEDFLKWKPEKKYDLVCSFGFVEHFGDPDTIFAKHIDLLTNGGMLIIEYPNFNYGQKILHSFLDRENLSRHNMTIMNLDYLDKIKDKFNLDVMFAGYYGGLFDFWWENATPSIVQRLVRLCLRYIAAILNKIPFNNRYFSPYIVLIAKSKGAR